MQKENLYRWMRNPEILDTTTLEALTSAVSKYPSFHSARLLYTNNLHILEHDDYETELAKSALFCSDRRKLFYLIYRDEYEKWQQKEGHHHSSSGDRTEQLLNSFLSSLGEKATSEPAIENPTLNMASIDYFSFLDSQGEENNSADQSPDLKLQHHDIIDAFIEKAHSETLFVARETAPSTKQSTDTKDEGGDFLTETLARIYIKQKKYEQALTIIKRLSLTFPKKSSYFADQIRFLEYLIINEKTNK